MCVGGGGGGGPSPLALTLKKIAVTLMFSPNIVLPMMHGISPFRLAVHAWSSYILKIDVPSMRCTILKKPHFIAIKK